jgi:cell wall-active antibiotic response 4TMS protein YvqF
MDSDRWERKRQRFERKMARWEQNWERRRYRWQSPGRHLFSGLLFVTIGAIFLLGNMGIVEVDRILRFWPVILIAAGMFKIIESGTDYGESAGIFWVVIGGLFLLGNLGILRVAFRDLWPVVLIGIGALMLWRSALSRRPPREFGRDSSASHFTQDTGTSSTVGTTAGTGEEGPSAATSTNSIVSAMAILGSVERRNNSQDFRGGSATAVMGRCEIDLRAADMTAPNQPVLEVFAVWGGIEVRVPPDWSVVSQVDPILGGYDDSTQPPKEESKRFIIRGSVIMGGIEVTN